MSTIETMMDINMSMISKNFHQPHSIHSIRDLDVDYKLARGYLPPYNYCELHAKQGPILNAYPRTPNTMYQVATAKHPRLFPVRAQYGPQSSFTPHLASQAYTNCVRHTIGSLNTPPSPTIMKSHIKPYALEPLGGHPIFESLPTSDSRSTGGKVVKIAQPVARFGVLNGRRAQPMASNHSWNDIEQAESIHKCFPVDNINPQSPYGQLKQHALGDRLIYPITPNLIANFGKNHVIQRESDSDIKKERSHEESCKGETRLLFPSRDPFAKPKDVITTTDMATSIPKLTSTPMHPLNHVNSIKSTDNNLLMSSQRRHKPDIPYSQRRWRHHPEITPVSFENNPEFYEKDKRILQLTYDLPKFTTTRAGPMTSLTNDARPLLHPNRALHPFSNNAKILHRTLPTDGHVYQPHMNTASCPIFPVHHGSHRFDPKFLNPLQSHHHQIREKLRNELEEPILTTADQSIQLKSLLTQRNKQSSNLVKSYSSKSEQCEKSTTAKSENGDESTISLPFLSHRSKLHKLFLDSTDTSILKRSRVKRRKRLKYAPEKPIPATEDQAISMKSLYTERYKQSSNLVHPNPSKSEQSTFAKSEEGGGNGYNIPLSTLINRPKVFQNGDILHSKLQQNKSFLDETHTHTSKSKSSVVKECKRMDILPEKPNPATVDQSISLKSLLTQRNEQLSNLVNLYCAKSGQGDASTIVKSEEGDGSNIPWPLHSSKPKLNKLILDETDTSISKGLVAEESESMTNVIQKPMPAIEIQSMSLKSLLTQKNKQPSNLVKPYSPSSEQGDASTSAKNNDGGGSTITFPTLSNKSKLFQNGYMLHFKLQKNKSFLDGKDTFSKKRSAGISSNFFMINEYKTLNKTTDAALKTGKKRTPCDCNIKPCRMCANHDIHHNNYQQLESVKSDQKLPADGARNMKRKNCFGESDDARHKINRKCDQKREVKTVKNEQKRVEEWTRNANGKFDFGEENPARHIPNNLPTIKHTENKNRYWSQLTYGEFLQEILVPMTLAVSNKDKKKQEKITSLVKLWRDQAKQIPSTFSSPSNGTSDEFNQTKPIVHDKKPNNVPISKWPSNHARSEDLGKNLSIEDLGNNLSIEDTNKSNVRGSKDERKNEMGAKEIFKHPGDRDAETDMKAPTLGTQNKLVTPTTSSTHTENTDTIKERNISLETTLPKEKDEEDSSSILQTPRIRSVRVVLRTSDRIRMKFYNVDGSRPEQPKEKIIKQKHKRRRNKTKKRLRMKIGSETLFIRSLYCSNISPRKHTVRRAKKANKKTKKVKTAPPAPKDFNRIALSVQKKEGETILHRAVRVNAKQVLLYCLENNIGDINAMDNAGYTPLHECCVFDKVWMAEKLILHGANVNACANDGTRPIHDAVENHRADMTRLLLSYGADPLIPTYTKRTALDNATSFEIVTLLHEYLRDINGGSEELLNKLTSSTTNRRTLRFKSSFSIQENEILTDNFLDTSDLTETAERKRDAIFYLKEIPQPRHFHLQLKENEMVKSWYLLSDVLVRLKIPAATFPYLYPHIKVNGLPTSIFLKKIERTATLNQYDFTALCGKREVVEFVEADNEMCCILQLEGCVC